VIVVIDLAGIAFAFWYDTPSSNSNRSSRGQPCRIALCVKQPSRELFNGLFVLVVAEHFGDINLVRTVTLH